MFSASVPGDSSPTRMAAQIVSGIGFLGAGSIILRNEAVKGLTTAASIWAVAGVGLAAGAGLYVAAVAATNALSNGPDLQERELAREILARQGLSIPVPPAPGFDWVGTITPGAIAVLLVVLIIFLRVTGADRAR